MKKVFTLLTLLVAMVTSAWADGTLIYKSDFTDNTAIWLTKDAVDGYADKTGTYWMVKGGKISGTKDLKNKILIDPSTNELAASAQYTSSTSFYVEKAYNSTKDSEDQSLYIYVTGVAKMYFYAWCNSTPDGRTLDITVNGTKKGEISFATSTANAQYTSVVLDKASNNIIRINGSNEVELVAIKPMLNITATAFQGVKKGSDALTLGTDYTVADGTKTITLTNTHKVASAPTNIKLIKRNTLSDESIFDEEVAVTFNAVASEGYFTSSSTIAIGSDNYTVKVPVDADPTLELSETSGSITLKSYEAITSKTVTLSGGNLVDGTYDVPAIAGITISPTTFTVSGGTLSDTEFTITPSSTTGASTDITFECGTATATYTLSFSQPAQGTATEVTSVSAATTWDWTKAGNGVTEVKLTDSTNPKRTDDFILSNLPEINNDANFNSSALKVKVEYPVREGKYMQGGYVTFKNTIPGTVAVTFTNTGGSNNDRCLTVDGTAYEDVKSGKGNSNGQVTKTVTIAAGEHTLSGQEVSSGAANYLRFYKIVFTPIPEAADPVDDGTTVTLTTSANMQGWRTFFDETQAYTVDENTTVYVAQTSAGKINVVSFTGGIPANTPVILHTSSSADSYKMTLTKVAPIDLSVPTNILNATTAASTDLSAGTYRLGYKSTNGVGFYSYSSATAPAGIVYILKSDVTGGGAPGFLDFFIADDNTEGGEATGIDAVEKAQKADGVYYNVNGQRVAQPTKGLYIVNGKKVIVK